ncbi:family 10 glycosylhydrolase [Gloeothece citriformis]|nr:family 10 glycosylhydrolase [Gloeothece citriformis]
MGQCWYPQPSQAAINAYCQLTPQEASTKENLLQTALKGNVEAEKDYDALVRKHAELLQRCRNQTWPQEQAIWLRLYPCDVRPGSIDAVLDRIVNKGYNTVYLEVFYDSQVLLPPNDNPTEWDTVVRTPGAENVDLLAETIKKGRERGLKIYAWLFTLNFGYVYSQRPDRQDVLARNGTGQTSVSYVHDQSQGFIDPYHPQAQRDYAQLVNAILKRQPDGVLFDYVRYPRGTGAKSAAGQVKDLWIYGSASRQALYDRALNNKGRALIERYVTQGYITANDIVAVDNLYPEEGSPLWQGRTPPPNEMQSTASARFERLRYELWYLAVAHAAQGVVNFLTMATTPVQRRGLVAGAVFFPDGNQIVGETGFDSRLQPWDKFPPSIEWHPMSYGICGNPSCIVQQVKRVTGMAPQQVKIIPALAGLWGRDYDKRPSLEEQMRAIRSAAPQINSISHFSFSWQEPDIENERRSCQFNI